MFVLDRSDFLRGLQTLYIHMIFAQHQPLYTTRRHTQEAHTRRNPKLIVRGARLVTHVSPKGDIRSAPAIFIIRPQGAAAAHHIYTLFFFSSQKNTIKRKKVTRKVHHFPCVRAHCRFSFYTTISLQQHFNHYIKRVYKYNKYHAQERRVTPNFPFASRLQCATRDLFFLLHIYYKHYYSSAAPIHRARGCKIRISGIV